MWLIEWWDNSVVKKVKPEETAYAWRETEAYMCVDPFPSPQIKKTELTVATAW